MVKREEMNQSLFDEVPSSIICDIVSRLPTKACLNCKLVCKEWHRIIMSSEFIELRRLCNPYFTLMFYGKFCNWTTSFLLLDLDKASNVDEMGNVSVGVDGMIRFKFEFNIPNRKLHLVNECNGVICLKAQEMWSPFVMCNPLTGQYVIVKQSRKPFHSVQGYGLGYCPVSCQFKVLRILMIHCKYVAEIQTLGTNVWRTVGDAQICKERIGAFLHGSLHWYSSKDHDIWSFHFGKEEFLRVSVPDDTKGNNSPDVSIFNSYLCFSCISKDGCQRDIWLMKEYGVKDSWVKQFVMERGEFGLLYVPLLRMSSGEILVSFRGRCNLLTYDQKSDTYRRVRVHGVSSFDVLAYDMKLSDLQ
ncbi:hypothetical protein RDABS01_012443 [Bienertia sinuspersici]